MSITGFSVHVYNSLKNNATALNVSEVLYADRDKLIGPVSVCVEPGPKEITEFRGTQTLATMEYTINVIVYDLSINDGDIASNVVTATDVATAIESFLNSMDKTSFYPVGTTGKQIIKSYCSSVEPGYARKNNNVAKATLITFRLTERGFI